MNFSFDRFLSVRSGFGATFDHDGRRLYFLSTLSGAPNLWSLRLDQPGCWPEPLALDPERVQYARPAPRAGRLVYGVDLGGNERTQLYLLDGPGRQSRALTRDPDVIHHLGDWHADGRTLCYAANARDEQYFDVHLLDVETGETRCVFQDDANNRALCYAPDGRLVLVQQSHTPFEHELLLVDRVDGSARSLTAGLPPGRFESAHWSPDGQTIYCASDHRGEFLAACALDPRTGAAALLSDDPWDVEDLAISPDGRRLAYSVNEEGYSRLYLHDWVEGTLCPVPLASSGLCNDAGRWLPTFAWSPDSTRLALTFTTARDPLDIWLVDAAGGSARQVTASWTADLPAESLCVPELVHYPTFDGRQISAFVFRSAATLRDGSAPGLCFVHGGPEWQLRPGLNPVPQYFAQRGFVVVAPNVRGSTGYGKHFSHLDDVERRLDAVRDLAAGAEWLAASGLAHPRKIAVMGASYGGYMVLAALTERPDLWAAGVDIVGIANFVTFLERTGPWRRRQREAEYGSLAEHRELLERISPLNRADRIAAPLLVIHGANDPRVPISEAEQLVAMLRARGQSVEYLRYEDEGHGLVKLANRLDAYPRIAAFLEERLLSGR